MAREVVTHVWCDVCLDEDETVTATETPPITIGNLKPRVLALCEAHWGEVFEPIKQILTELGQVLPETSNAQLRRPPGTAPGSGIFPCPDTSCSKHEKPYRHEQSLRNHAKQVHGLNGLKELYATFGGELRAPEPEDALFESEQPSEAQVIAAEPKVKRAECDHCDVVYEWPEYVRPVQALGVHKSKKHGVRGAKHDRKKSA